MQPANAETILTASRTTTLLVSLLVALCSGTNYVYSAYGPQLGHRLQLSHADQNLVGISGNVGVAGFAPILGKLADSRGPRTSLSFSFVLLLTGYLGIKAIYDASKGNTEPVGGKTFLALIIFELLSGIGSQAGYCAALNAVMKSFPDKIRGTVTGIVISGFGLSAFFFSTIARTIFLGNTSGFLLTIALGTPAAMVLGWFLIRTCPYPEVQRATSVGDDRGESANPNSTANEASQLTTKNTRVRPESITGLALVRTSDFWVLFWIVSLLSGSGIMWINNVGLMSRALVLKGGANPDEQEYMKWQTLQVSTMSIASCVGRIAIGVIADYAKQRGVRRVQCISVVATSFLLSQLVGLRVQDIERLQYAVILVGVSYGSVFGLTPVIVIEWFGMAHVSENRGLVNLSLLVTGNVFSMVFGRIFDSHSTGGEHGMHCFEGARCYSASLYVTTLACICASVLARVAVERDRKYI